jgi:hypothetical protein
MHPCINTPLNLFCLLILIVSLTMLTACNTTGINPDGNIDTDAQTSPPDATGRGSPGDLAERLPGDTAERLPDDTAERLPDAADIETTDPIVVALNWMPSPGEIDGYIIHSGPTPETADVILMQTPSTSIVIDVAADLGLAPGDTACFRIKAYNAFGVSDFSGAACFAITA